MICGDLARQGLGSLHIATARAAWAACYLDCANVVLPTRTCAADLWIFPSPATIEQSAGGSMFTYHMMPSWADLYAMGQTEMA